MGDVLFESGGQVPTSLADVHLPTFAGDPVDTSFLLLVLLVLVGLQRGLNLLGCYMKYSDVGLMEDALDLVGCITYVSEDHCSLMRRGLTLGIGDLTVSGLGFLNLMVAVVLEGSSNVLVLFLYVFLVADLVGSLHQGTVDGGLDPRME